VLAVLQTGICLSWHHSRLSLTRAGMELGEIALLEHVFFCPALWFMFLVQRDIVLAERGMPWWIASDEVVVPLDVLVSRQEGEGVSCATRHRCERRTALGTAPPDQWL
jgi:hypothetical protein